MGEETLLIVSLALCFGMVVMAAHTGFSAAFGAFIMGSILAETIEAESIDRLVKPVKDLFGAIFFVSVGMMVDPAMIVEYAVPIIVITLAVILGQAVFGTFGVILSGKPLKTAMQCGFSLTQIGEFAFIIASLGVSLHVTSDFLYPTVVAVSVITVSISVSTVVVISVCRLSGLFAVLCIKYGCDAGFLLWTFLSIRWFSCTSLCSFRFFCICCRFCLFCKSSADQCLCFIFHIAGCTFSVKLCIF